MTRPAREDTTMMLPLEATKWGRACEVRWTYALKLTSTILSVMVRFWGLPSHIPRGIGRMWFRIRMSIPPNLLTASWNKKSKVKVKIGQGQIIRYHISWKVKNMAFSTCKMSWSKYIKVKGIVKRSRSLLNFIISTVCDIKLFATGSYCWTQQI